MKTFFTIILAMMSALGADAQDRSVENRPYTDLRPFHFGVVLGTHLQDMELNNVGPVTIEAEDGGQYTSVVSVDQDRWDPGFQVGVLGEARLGTHFAFRLAPMLYFGTKHLTFRNLNSLNELGQPKEEVQNMKSVYIATTMDIIFSAKRFNNHRPYIVAGLTPMFNLTTKANDYLRLKKYDMFMSVGIGCDFYLPFFKLRPELKFMYSLMNSLDTKHAGTLRDASMLPYAYSADKTRTKMICLSLYFE
ncbi:MAG: PorT family protein [Bacteroidales bacterium]|nr:PorT family protein [Bacteroidales bacterium]MCM1147092.1 PorT family protein [Bacteroidales bacterium]MCM1205774.1 PorT family protein [Bacillota bacterium]MCM1511167.1 PorT family protein [Clostridium sp.]